MPNAIDSAGLTLKTRDEIVASLTDGDLGVPGYRAIYGADINLDPNTPDGQFLQLMAQIAIDVEELLQQIYTGFDPDTAIGVGLDRACAYNGVQRQAGTRSTQYVTVTATQALTIAGIDTAPTAPFTISDNAGNRFALIEAHAFGAAGTADLNFQAIEIGPTLVGANTLTTIVTVQLGVASVTNGVLTGTVGVAAETDYTLRLRRQQSVSIPSKGYLQGLYGQLLAISGVTSALVLENTTNVTDADGIPDHSIWVIVNGGTNAEVANAIYVKRNAGCGMLGAVHVNITQVDGTIFQVAFDRPTPEDLWISFDVAAVTGSIDVAFIRAQILEQLSYTINQPADASAVTLLVKTIAPNASVSDEGVSNDGISYVSLLSNATKDKQWSIDTTHLIINGSPGP